MGYLLGGDMKEEIVYVKGRLDSDLHKELKAIAKEDKRSIVYLLNEAVKLLVEKHKSAKAWLSQTTKKLLTLDGGELWWSRNL